MTAATIQQLRDAFCNGSEWRLATEENGRSPNYSDVTFLEQAAAAAAERFPITRPREVRCVTEGGVSEFLFRVIEGVLEWTTPGLDDWEPYGTVRFDSSNATAFAAMVADLYANPTESVRA